MSSAPQQIHACSYFAGIVLPLVLATFAGFLAFITNPDSGERIGLGISVLLVTAVLYLVAVEVLPKSRHWTCVHRLYICSITLSFTALMTSVVVAVPLAKRTLTTR